MSKITPLMTSLHEGHKTEERLKCIDDILFRHKKCEDTKWTILQAFWWYRKHSISMGKVKKAREEITKQFVDLQDGSEEWRSYVNETVLECVEILDKLIAESEEKE